MNKGQLRQTNIQNIFTFFELRGRFLARCAVCFLLVSFLLQPIVYVYADEGSTEATSAESKPESDQTPEPEPEPDPVPEPDVEPEPEEEAAESVEHEIVDIEEDAIEEEVKSEHADESHLKQDVEAENMDETTDSYEVVTEEVQDANEELQDLDPELTATSTETSAEISTEIETVPVPPLEDSASTTAPVVPDVLGTSTDTVSDDTSSTPIGSTGGPADEVSEEEIIATTTAIASSTLDATATTTPETQEIAEDLQDEFIDEEFVPDVVVDSEQEDAINETASSTEEYPEISTTTPTSTPEIVYVQSTSTVNNALNRYQFAEHECTVVGDGSFYCNKAEKTESMLEDGVYAATDEDGDQEIYLVRNGKETKITDNLYDDTAPYFDEVSKRIVWHSLRNDRYQIVSYSLENGDSTVLTNTSYNNMEPTAFGDITLWQAWIGNDWEIMMDEDGEQTQLTDNAEHDVSPEMKGNYIVWQTQVGDKWFIKVFDRNTETVETIEGDGSLVDNPRFVLVYDSTKANGDIETVGYDLKTKQVVPLSSQPAPTPDDIPEPDTTGEERALVQKTPSPKLEVEEEDTDGTDGVEGEQDVAIETAEQDSEEDVIPEDIASSTEQAVASGSADIIVPPVVLEEQIDTESVRIASSTDEQIEHSEVVVDSTEEDTSTEHIEDLLIPTYEPDLEERVE